MHELTNSEFKFYELKTLKKIDEICMKNNFRYYLAYGTLLGAIRHKGFIPWDDDVDIWMPRPDYEKFVKYCIDNEEKMGCYQLVHYRNNINYCMGMARFYDKRTKVLENHVREYGLGVFIDVYPLDGCGNNVKSAEHIFVKNRNKRFLSGIGAPEKYEKSKSGLVGNLVKFCCYKYANCIGINKILEKMDYQSMKYKFEDEYVATTVWAIYRKGTLMQEWIGKSNSVDIFRREWFDNILRVDFENIKVNIPSEYHKILSHRYGDYMKYPPISEQNGHHDFLAYLREEYS